MKAKIIHSVLLISLVSSYSCSNIITRTEKVLLKDNWAIQSSVEVKDGGSEISTTAFTTEKWYPATVPSTVLGTLIENKVYPDPYFGTNIESLPGYFPRRGAA